MLAAQKRIQAQLFLSQTAQTTIESMSRQLRYGYTYSAAPSAVSFDGILRINESVINITQVLISGGSTATTTDDVYATTTASSGYASTSQTASGDLVTRISYQLLTNSENSPFIIFENQSGNPNSYSDQNAFCAMNGKLYKISSFDVQTNGTTYERICTQGSQMLPDSITIENLSFDVIGGSTSAPRNPTVRIKMRLKHDEAGSIDIQTSVTQRLTSYF